jgi:hypothetical protein
MIHVLAILGLGALAAGWAALRLRAGERCRGCGGGCGTSRVPGAHTGDDRQP